jgi:RNA polymerase sigma factor (sigma-70 family)
MGYTVAIVEDNLLYQQALVTLINGMQAFSLGKVYSSAEAAMEMKRTPPDMAILDIQLPGMSGIELIRELRKAGVATQFVVCSMHDDDNHIMQALEYGAIGYILKESSTAQIQQALEEVVRGGAPMSPYIARRVIQFFQRPKQEAMDGLLRDREREVLQLLAEGLQYKEIAGKLYISHETVKKHLKNIYQKLHVQNKIEALNKYRAQQGR